MEYQRISVDDLSGAITCFAIRGRGELLGMSAFHVLSGEDKQIDKVLYTDVVELQNNELGEWVSFGHTIEGEYFEGNRMDGDFGLMDYALFHLEKPFIDRIDKFKKPLNISKFLFEKNPSFLKGVEVFGYSVMYKKNVTGFIDRTHFSGIKHNYDIVIKLSGMDVLSEGDSGMLWRDEKGEALAMHIGGNDKYRASNSYSTLMDRIVERSNINLYQIDINNTYALRVREV